MSAQNLGWSPKEPTARGIARAVSRAIREGVLAAGTKLPPIRTVAKELDVSPTTVNAAWTLLAQSGFIRTGGRRGTTVADPHSVSQRYRRALDHRELFKHDLSNGIPDLRLLPSLDVALDNLTTSTLPSGYLDPPIVPKLLELLRDDWPYEPERFMIFDGAMDALDMTIRTRLRFGDRVVVEDPGFPLLFDGLEAAGVDIVGVPLDNRGMVPGSLAEALGKPTSAIFLQPRAHNPTGISMTAERARELAEIIRPSNAMVIEDDSAGAIASSPAISLGQWLPEQTIHIRSFSKSHGPDLRLAALSASRDTTQELIARRQLGQGWSSRHLQQILVNMLTHKQTIAQTKHARQEYRRRRDAIVHALAARGIRIPGSDGFNLWLPVAHETSALIQLTGQGIGAAAGRPFVVSSTYRDHIRITISTIDKDFEKWADIIASAAMIGQRRGGR